jgi:H+/gluconate symporter-like permease
LKANLSPLLLGWFVAALIRLATGSATVAMTRILRHLHVRKLMNLNPSQALKVLV